MHANIQFVVGIVVIHAVLALAYVAGSILRRRARVALDPATAAIDIVISIGAGFAAIGLISFFAGLVGLFTPAGFAIVLFAVAATGRWTQQCVWERHFWADRVHELGLAASSPGVRIVWGLSAFLAYPAAQPPTAFDALFFHQVYALEWAQHHGIYVDLYRRFPWYAQNWIVIYAWFDVFGLSEFVQFVNWATYALSAMLVYGLTRTRLAAGSLTSELVAAAAPLPLLLSPLFLRWADTGMVDSALAFYFFLAVVVGVRTIVEPEADWWFTAALLAGFLIGMKPTLFVFAPLFGLFLAIAGVKRGLSLRQVGLMLAALVLISAPWYVKNVAQDADPIPPMFNFILHHPDGSYSREDVDAIRTASFATDGSPLSLIELPVRMFLDPGAADFQELGMSAEVLLLGGPFLALALGFRKRRPAEMTYWAAALCFAFAYWILTTHLGRYAMLFYPLLTVFTVCAIIAVVKRIAESLKANAAQFAQVAAGVGSIALALPSPASVPWMQAQYQTNYVDANTVFPSREAYLQHFPGYPEEEAVSAWLAAHPELPKRVLSFRLETLAYFFAENHVQSFGDWIGPARYGDFAAAIRAGRAADYVRAFDLSAIIVPQTNELLKAPDLQNLGAQLANDHFRKLPSTNNLDVYVKVP